MLRGLPVTVIIPVRGGSKGIPRKNLYRLGGLTLLERAILIAQGSSYVDNVLVSTDNDEMYSIAQHYNVASSSKRPPELSDDTSSTIDVINHTVSRKIFTAPGLFFFKLRHH